MSHPLDTYALKTDKMLIVSEIVSKALYSCGTVLVSQKQLLMGLQRGVKQRIFHVGLVQRSVIQQRFLLNY